MKRKYNPYYLGYALGMLFISIYFLYVLDNYGYKSAMPLLIILMMMEIPVVFDYFKKKKS